MRAKVERWNDGLFFGTAMLFASGLFVGLAIIHVLPQ